MERVSQWIVFLLLCAVWLCPIRVFAGPDERASGAIYFGYEVNEHGKASSGHSSAQQVELGETLTAALYVHNATNLVAYELSFGYDPAKLKGVSWSENGASSNVLYRDGRRTPFFDPPGLFTSPLIFRERKRCGILRPRRTGTGYWAPSVSWFWKG